MYDAGVEEHRASDKLGQLLAECKLHKTARDGLLPSTTLSRGSLINMGFHYDSLALLSRRATLEDLLLHLLEPIVKVAPHILMSIPDNPCHVLCRAPFVKLQLKSIPQTLDGRFTLERRQAGTQH